MEAAALIPVLLLVPMSWVAVFFLYRDVLLRLWREPVLRHPVCIIESDDWGPGPVAHADALERIRAILASHRDETGRAAVMSIGVILGAPDNAVIRANACRTYSRTTLADSAQATLREAMSAGEAAGVLALQLHGLEHLWAPVILSAAQSDASVRRWIEEESGTATEALPSHLQSRWIDASSLPSMPLPREAIDNAVKEETGLFAACFGHLAEVVVPPTFVWNEAVESAWSACGVRVIVTPGRRYTARDQQGRPAGVDKRFFNGEIGPNGVIYLVRDIYFEPDLGHRAERVVAELMVRARLGRPALLETHRFNFINEHAKRNLAELDRLLALARKHVDGLRFISPSELAEAFRSGDPAWVEPARSARFVVWLRRVVAHGRLRKLAWLTGLMLPLGGIYLLLGGHRAHLHPEYQ